MASLPPMHPDSDDYSAAATLIPFHCPLPLLRGPIKAGPLDDPSRGPYLLAFKDPYAWEAAYGNSKSQIILQCESGARIGCSISASRKCRPPWWKNLLGISSDQDFKERVRCEEIEMEACFIAAKERCGAFAKEKCGPAYKNARIKVNNSLELKVVDPIAISRLISRVCFAEKKGCVIGMLGIEKSLGEFRRSYEITNIRGSDLLGSDNTNIEDYLKESS